MGLKTTIDRIFTNKYRGDALRQIVLPGIATGIGATVTTGGALTYGVWVDVALLAAITLDTLVVGIAFDTPSGAEIFTIDIGSCQGFANAAALNGGGAPAIAAAQRAVTRIEIASDAGGYVPVYLQNPVFIPAGVGIVARGYSVSGADTLNISVICLQNM